MDEVLAAIRVLGNELSDMKVQISSMQREISGIKQEMSGIKEEISNMREEFNEKLDNTRIEFNEKLEDTKKELLDRQFLFEHEYGDKIKAMYDIMVITKDKEYDNHKDIEKLDNRLTRAEADIFKHGEDIKVLVQSR